MHISHVKISNFRALQSVSVPLNTFSVLLGENDVGKTSFLHALDKFFIGKKLSDSNDWFDFDTDVDIRIVLTFQSAGSPSPDCPIPPRPRTARSIDLRRMPTFGRTMTESRGL